MTHNRKTAASYEITGSTERLYTELTVNPATRYRGDIGMAYDIAIGAAIWDPTDFDPDSDELGCWQFDPNYTRVATTADMGPDALRYAQLFAASPELLQIARRVAEHFADTDAPLGAAARSAIAKATGGSRP